MIDLPPFILVTKRHLEWLQCTLNGKLNDMPTILLDTEASKLVPRAVTNDEERLRLKMYLERSDLVRIAHAAASLLIALDATEGMVDHPQGMRTAPNSRAQLLQRIRNWAGPVELADLVMPDRVGGSST